MSQAEKQAVLRKCVLFRLRVNPDERHGANMGPFKGLAWEMISP